MSSKPKQPKVKPVNDALIRQTRSDISQQTQRIEQGLMSYQQSALSGISTSTAQQKAAISNSISDQRTALNTVKQTSQATQELLQRRVTSQGNANTANTQLAKVANTTAQRGTAQANNNVAAKQLMRRNTNA
jgi:hypothetical protein